MTDYIRVILFIIVELLSYSMGYAILFRARFTRNPRPYIIVGVTVLLVEGIAAWRGYPYYFWDFIALFCVIVPLFFMEKRKAKWFLLFPPILFGISIFYIALSFAMGLWTGRLEAEIVKDKTSTLVCESLGLFLLFGIRIVQRLIKKERKEYIIDKSQYVLFYIGSFCSFILIGCMQRLMLGKTLND